MYSFMKINEDPNHMVTLWTKFIRSGGKIINYYNSIMALFNGCFLMPLNPDLTINLRPSAKNSKKSFEKTDRLPKDM